MRPCVLLVRQYIENNFPRKNVSEPSKDSGFDLLVTNQGNTRSLNLNVYASYASQKFIDGWPEESSVKKEFRAAGLFTPERKQLDQSVADLWVLVLPRSEKNTIDYVLIPPKELSKRLEKLKRPPGRKYFIYVWITMGDRAWLGRGLSKKRKCIAENKFENKDRELTQYLNNWSPVQEL